jgi:hypothetical protein
VEVGLLVYLAFASGTNGELDNYSGGKIILSLGAAVFALVFAGFAYLIFRSWPAVQIIGPGVKLPGLFELIGIAAALFAAIVGALTVLRPEGGA